ncbi:hypothetical protein IAQ61_007452 [Plenodomus lingam]|uniref:O-methyltransferase sirM n=2 Tax=Leptosphaeria maculans TaxID=5022 RepID=SIRM_LEPMC|nr:hypothetical protein LEMA_P081790.1 [Plenodomus lingam JN3]Q6Q880.1 RecName: Full=O-methyltransferase sirM; AltName: Full=Sirodesmin biosynthesis protein M [Plenodomus lingam]AAS92548.1 SirM [Plenodomus lingam]KAH9866863.1 hypothetical protein IAQ61_007452 [Plenodomus lingam]CBX98940.1 hypothetical protein LEMA_P081790.1 [Plenodomus lingam JN3]
MDNELDNLISLLQKSKASLKEKHGDRIRSIFAAHHSGSILPKEDKSLYDKCLATVDLLDEVQQMLTPPLHTLIDGFFGFINSKTLLCAVEFGIPDALSQGPKSIEQLASSSPQGELSPHRLTQVLRTLTGIGIFNYDKTSKLYSNNATSDLITTAHWSKWVYWTKFYPTEFYDMMRFLPDHIKANASRTAAQSNYNTDMEFYEYLSNSGLAKEFHRVLGAGATAQLPGMISDFPWDTLGDETVLDLGTGSGEFLFQLLENYPRMRGAFMDIPSTISRIQAECEQPGGRFSGVRDRVAGFHAGNFLDEVPASVVYTIKWCLHNWSDEDTIKILQNIRRAIVVKPEARLLIIESVLEDGRTGRPARYGDIIMMATCNGKERDIENWQAVCEQSGWEVVKSWALRNSIPSCLELRPI